MSRRYAAFRRHAGVIAAGAVWIFFVANFSLLRISGGDAPVQYECIQRLFGERSHASGYFFGLGLLEAPFYGVGRLLEQLGIHQLGGSSIEMALVALGSGVFVLPAGLLVARLLRKLELPAAGSSLLAAAFGTSLVFWVVFSPGKDHPADTALFSLVVYLVFLYFNRSEPSRPLLWAIGATLGFSITVRYFAGAEAVALCAVLSMLRRWRHAAEIALSTAVSCALLFLIPLGLGTPVFSGAYTVSQQTGFYPLNPLRMLFTEHRGLFVWSPVTVLALIGLVLLYRRRPEQRPFLLAAYAMAVAIMLSYVFVPYWDGAWSFGQRYYTPLFPLVVIGLAAVIDASKRRVRIAVVAAMAVTTIWSVYLCLSLALIGPGVYTGPTFADGAVGVARLPQKTGYSTGEYLWSIYYRSRLVRPILPWPFAHG